MRRGGTPRGNSSRYEYRPDVTRQFRLQLIDTLHRGDRLLVSELSRLGRSLGQILQIVERLMHQGVQLVAHGSAAPKARGAAAGRCQRVDGTSSRADTLPRRAGRCKSRRTPRLLLAGVGVLLASMLVGAVRTAQAGSSFKVGSFTKTTAGAPASQVVAHGLGETPKALILWTASKTSESLSADFGFAVGFTDGSTDKSAAASSWDDRSFSETGRRIANKALTISGVVLSYAPKPISPRGIPPISAPILFISLP